MSRLGCIIFILPLIGYPHFELTAQSQLKSPKEGTSTVSGRVTLKGEPARGITVVLRSRMIDFPPDPDPDSTPRAKTDEDGRFRITKVTAGRYYIRAMAPGLVAAGWIPFRQEGKSLILANGENAENIDLELKPGGVITGRIVDSEGHPLVEEHVRLMKLDHNGKPGHFYFENLYAINSTDDRGIYRIYGLPEGRYLVSVGVFQGEGSFAVNPTYYPRTFHPNVRSESDAKVIDLSEGAEVTGVDITVAETQKAYDVYGRVVTAETGKGVAQAWISYSAVSSDGRMTIGGGPSGEQSNEKGEFHLRGVSPGKFSLLAIGNQDSEFYSDPVISEVNDSDVRGIEIKVRQAGSISGVVVIEGTSDPAILNKLSKIQDGVVYRQDPIIGTIIPITVNPDGSFRAKGVPPGKNDLLVFENPELQGLTMSRVERDRVLHTKSIEVGPGEQVSNVRVVLNYGILVIRGEVKIVGGTLPKNVGLYVRSSRINTQASNGGDIDSRGQFMIKNLSPGEYELSLSHYILTPGQEQVDEHYLKAISQAKQRVIVTTDNQPQVTLVLDLSRREGDQ